MIRRLIVVLTLALSPCVWGQMNVGVNLAAQADWGTDARYADALSAFRLPGTVADPYDPSPAVKASESTDGIPSVDWSSYAALTAYPAGVYQLSYTGSANLTFTGATVTNQRTAAGVTTADVSIDPAKAAPLGGIRLTVTNSQGLDHLHLWSPGTGPGDVFRPEFIAKLARFTGPIRVMDNHLVNTPTEVNWSDRTSPAGPWRTYLNAGQDSAGVAWEDDIALANQLGRPLYLNIPVTASSSYQQSLAALVKSKLNPALPVYVAVGNEMQFSAGQGAIVDAKAAADATLTATDQYGRRAQETFALDAAAAQVFKAAGVSNATGVFEGWTTLPWYNEQALSWAKARYGTSMGGVSRLAVAPYPGSPATAPGVTTATNLDQLFAAVMADLSGTTHNALVAAADDAKAYGLIPTTYEGGQSITGSPLADAAQADPRMAEVYRLLLSDLKSLGYQDAVLYDAIQGNSQYGDWGLWTSVDQASSVKGDAVTAFITDQIPEPAIGLALAAVPLLGRRRRKL